MRHTQLFVQNTKAVVFDIDNTLLETDLFVREHIRTTAQKVQQTFIPSLSIPLADQIAIVQKENLPFVEMFSRLFDGRYENSTVADLILKVYRETAPRLPYQPTQYAKNAIAFLKEHSFTICLLTNRTTMIEERLRQVGFDPNDFYCILPPPKKEFAKPHHFAFVPVITRLREKGIQKEEILVIGDHPDDYISSRHQNLLFGAVLTGTSTKDDFLTEGLSEVAIRRSLESFGSWIQLLSDMRLYKESITAITPIDGRYRKITHVLQPYLSEAAFYAYRVHVEVEHLIALSQYTGGEVVRTLSENEKTYLRNLYLLFTRDDAFAILSYDHLGRNGIGPLEHDTKAVELWIQEKLEDTSLSDIREKVHMFVTSEDIRNLALKLMLKDVTHDVVCPSVKQVADLLYDLTQAYIDTPLLARTHLQPASPTTYGKVFGGYLHRLTRALQQLDAHTFTGKCNGAIGNYHTFVAAYPQIDWKEYSTFLTTSLGIASAHITDQRGTMDDIIRFWNQIKIITNIMRDLAQDCSLYYGFGVIFFEKIESHVGSSVMPHKVNPWPAEAAEGNFKKVNALINCLTDTLDVSRLQRDLSDHDLERSYADVIGYFLIGVSLMTEVLRTLRVDKTAAEGELREHPVVTSEAIQTILRKYNVERAYEQIKKKTRGGHLTLSDMKQLVIALDVPDSVRQELCTHLDPTAYIGLAVSLARDCIAFYDEYNGKQ